MGIESRGIYLIGYDHDARFAVIVHRIVVELERQCDCGVCRAGIGKLYSTLDSFSEDNYSKHYQ